jgi:hypothetical protein
MDSLEQHVELWSLGCQAQLSMSGLPVWDFCGSLSGFNETDDTEHSLHKLTKFQMLLGINGYDFRKWIYSCASVLE